MRKILFAVAVAAMMSGCTFGTIDPGHVGVVVPLTGDEKGTLETRGNGWYLYGYNTKVYEFPTYNLTASWKAEGNTSGERMYFRDTEGLRLGVDVAAEYNVPRGQVPLLFTSYRADLDVIRDTHLKRAVQNALSVVAKDYSAEQIFGTKREEFFQKAHELVARDLANKGLVVSKLYMNGEIELPQQIQATIQAKLQATMFAQQKENEKRTVEAEAAKQVAEAKGAAEAAAARAQGEAAARVAQAKGEAEAATAAAKGRADALLLEATAQAQANAKLAQSLTGAILELRKLEIQADVQKSYAEAWGKGGAVPQTILPQQAGGYMMDIRGMQSR